jgi:hypothetical protein
MSWSDALEIVVGRTKHEAYRRQCSDENTSPPPNDRDAYRALMVRLASDPPNVPSQYPPAAPASPTARESLALIQRMRACPFWSKPGTGCDCGRCGLRAGAKVTHHDCFACLERYG